jgi:hypothetical protein
MENMMQVEHMMPDRFRLYWRRETGCDSGTSVGLEDLDPAIRSRVAELAGELPRATLLSDTLLSDAVLSYAPS